MGEAGGAAKVLVSACLLGEPCRYDGRSEPCGRVIALGRTAGVELVPACPEQLGGLPTPRTASELQPDGRVVDRDGVDRTAAFRAGAEAALAIAHANGCTHAILKENSPSCGVSHVHDGTFTGRLVPGEGVTAATLRHAGLTVQSERDVPGGRA